jgi:cyanoexosortase B-associated protein
VSVKARFFRAWNQQTFAVVQWYAFNNGGHFSPANWFWQDQLAQLSDRRVPWVAVCLKIPIEPLGELKDAQSVAESLAKTVQTQLNNTVFSNYR